VSQFKRLIGKTFSDPDIQHELQSRMVPYNIVEQPDGKVGIKVSLNSRNESKNEMSFQEI
jgi:molecular chaperone DnaK (HSP70)